MNTILNEREIDECMHIIDFVREAHKNSNKNVYIRKVFGDKVFQYVKDYLNAASSTVKGNDGKRYIKLSWGN